MATVHFGTLWLNLASDLTQAVGLSLHNITHSPQVNVASEVMAGGNAMMFTSPGRVKQAQVALNFLTDDQVATLKTWQGELILFRSPDGEKFYGYFADPNFNPRPADVGTPTSFTVNEISVDEAV